MIRGLTFFFGFGGSCWDYLRLLLGLVSVEFWTDCHDTQTTARIIPSRLRLQIRPVAPLQQGQIEIGFALLSKVVTRMKYGLNRKLPLEVIFGNAAPRKGHSQPLQAVDMVIAYFPKARLIYVGTGGESLAFAREHLDYSRSFVLKVTDEVTDYRSAFIPWAFERLLLGDQTVIQRPLTEEEVPQPQTVPTVVSVDSFGNLIIEGPTQSLSLDGTPEPAAIELRVEGCDPVTAHLGKNLGDAEVGELVVSSGSTSRLMGRNGRSVFYVYMLGGSARRAIGPVRIGARFDFRADTPR